MANLRQEISSTGTGAASAAGLDMLQEITTRLPGRLDPGATLFGSASDLASALSRAAAAHGKHEKRLGQAIPLSNCVYSTHPIRILFVKAAAERLLNTIASMINRLRRDFIHLQVERRSS